MLRQIATLLAWYRTHKRDLPWRRTRDPYRIFVSEIMLQQTQVDRVIPKYREWLKRFSNWTALARAATPELIHAWAGLGYNRRALYMRDAARQVLEHGTPTTEKAWRELKGVGAYTAAALAAFANRKRSVVIDTNVRRVTGRIFLGKPFPTPKDDAEIRLLLHRIAPRTEGLAILPQAFMDFGSAVCTSRSPACVRCPLKQTCRAAPRFLSGKPLPRRTKAVRESRHRGKKHPDRIYRGRILAWIRMHGPAHVDAMGRHVDETFNARRDCAWIGAMVGRLAKDGLLVHRADGIVSLPQS